MQRVFIVEASQQVGQKVKVAGWVSVRRAHGKMVFIDLRDRSGVLQCVFLPQHQHASEAAQDLRTEWVVELTGEIVARPEKMVNQNLATGKVELVVEQMTVLAKAETLPFDVTTNGAEIGEEVRMKHRYLDLRRPRMQRNLIMRHKMVQFMRNFFSAEGFVEVETPMLTKSTPEGARDFVVPSRLHPGQFYALPQSPQQYKQLLMVAGLERYFQIARAMRDEDLRGDRQPEHTQLDMEMSFIERDDFLDMFEKMLIALVREVFPEKIIQEIPFPRISYKEAMEKYGSDKPDLRRDKNDANLLAFCWIVDFPYFEKNDPDVTHKKSEWTFVHNPFSAPKPEFLPDLMAGKNIGGIVANQYDIAMNGWELGSGGIRNNNPEAIMKVFEIMGYGKEEIMEKFGHMVQAYSYGAPRHGGIGFGIDRLIALLLGEPNIREVIAFPKTGDGRDLMMQAPSPIYDKQLKELHISIVGSEKKPVKKTTKAKTKNK